MLKLIDLFDLLDTKNGRFYNKNFKFCFSNYLYVYLDCYVKAKQYFKIKKNLFEEYGQEPMTREEEEMERKRFILMDTVDEEKNIYLCFINFFFRIILVQ